jgi:ribosomal protein L37AE/L43A
MRSYHLVCARDQIRGQHLRVPSGIWFCAACGRVMWDLDSFVAHTQSHAGHRPDKSSGSKP